MATIRKKHRAPVSVFQRDPGPWSRLLIDWLATLAVIMIFGLVMLFSASYTTGYLRMGDSFHYIKQQALCMMLGLGCMFLMSYVDHRFLRKMVVPGYIIVLAMLAVTLTMAPLNGCRRWIRFGGLTLQSSEVAKFEMILFSSHLAAKAPQVERLDPERRILLTPREWLRVRVWKQLVIPVLPLIPVIALLIAIVPRLFASRMVDGALISPDDSRYTFFIQGLLRRSSSAWRAASSGTTTSSRRSSAVWVWSVRSATAGCSMTACVCSGASAAARRWPSRYPTLPCCSFP